MPARLLSFALALVNLAGAQTFEVASIRASHYQSNDGEPGSPESIEPSPNGLNMHNVTLRACIAWAYDVQDFQISGVPGTDRFDIAARSSGGGTVRDLRMMLGALLAERFKLTLHRDSKDLSSLALVVAKGGPKAALQVSSEDGPGALRPNGAVMTAQHASMAEFIATLSGPMKTPVVDKTGLTARYDFTVDLRFWFATAKPGDRPDLIEVMTTALRDQLGLNLEQRKERVEILVVDHADRAPSAN